MQLTHPIAGVGLWRVRLRRNPRRMRMVPAHTAFEAYSRATPLLGPVAYSEVDVELVDEEAPAEPKPKARRPSIRLVSPAP